MPFKEWPLWQPVHWFVVFLLLAIGLGLQQDWIPFLDESWSPWGKPLLALSLSGAILLQTFIKSRSHELINRLLPFLVCNFLLLATCILPAASTFFVGCSMLVALINILEVSSLRRSAVHIAMMLGITVFFAACVFVYSLIEPSFIIRLSFLVASLSTFYISYRAITYFRASVKAEVALTQPTGHNGTASP